MVNLFDDYGKYLLTTGNIGQSAEENRLIFVGKKVPLGARSSGAEGFFRSCGFLRSGPRDQAELRRANRRWQTSQGH